MRKMMTVAILGSLLSLATSCKKNELKSEDGESQKSQSLTSKKYNCFCTTTISFVDHCGIAESYSDSSDVVATNDEQAISLCSANSASAISEYTILEKDCVIK